MGKEGGIEETPLKEKFIIIGVILLLIVGITFIYYGVKESATPESKADKIKNEIRNTASEVEEDLNKINNILGGGK